MTPSTSTLYLVPDTQTRAPAANSSPSRPYVGTVHLAPEALAALKPIIQKPIPGFPELTIDTNMVVRYATGKRAGEVVDNRWRPAGKAHPHIRIYLDGQEFERDVVDLYNRAFGPRAARVLTDNEVRGVRAMFALNAKVRDIGRRYNIHAATVYQIASGKIYSKVPN